MTIAVYLQVDRFFPPEVTQRNAINQLLARSKIAPSSVQWFIDREDKNEFKQLEADVRAGAIQAVIMYSIEQAYPSIAAITDALGLMSSKEMSFASVSQNIFLDKDSLDPAVSLLTYAFELADKYKRMKQRIGIEKAQAKGLYKGKKAGSVKPKFDPKKIPRWKARGKSAKWIANKLGCAESTVFRYLRIYRQK